ncbi:MAG TPA: ROK family protein [Pyrinomonadaceae bacterium]|nr:ROK family protein [Pyrinomonadaceae bacterium]
MTAKNPSTILRPRMHFIGINISGTQARAALVNSEGSVIEGRFGEVAPKQLVQELAAMVEDLRKQNVEVGAIGVAIPGLVNRQTDRVIAPRDLPSTIVGDLHGDLMRATGLRVELENDANAAAYGEFKVGAGRGARNLFYMMIGNGIGGAIILDGKLWTGASGFAGEVGHITIDTEGIECVCGNTGCLETVASAPSIVRRARERLNRDSTSSLSRLALNKAFTAEDVAHQANEGDDFALMMIERTGKYIGTGVASVINLLNIERIVLGGGVMDAGSLILNPIIQEVKRRAFQPCFEATEIVAAKLGLDGAPIGAALLARDTTTD